MGRGHEMMKVNRVSKVVEPVSISKRLTGAVDISMMSASTSGSHHLNEEFGPDCSQTTESEGGNKKYKSQELDDSAACGEMEIDNENSEEEILRDVENIDLVPPVENVIGNRASGQRAEKLDSIGHI